MYNWNINLRAILTTFITCLASLPGLFVGKAAKQNTAGGKESCSPLLNAYYIPETILSTFHILVYYIFPSTSCGRYHLHFTQDPTKVWQVE